MRAFNPLESQEVVSGIDVFDDKVSLHILLEHKAKVKAFAIGGAELVGCFP